MKYYRAVCKKQAMGDQSQIRSLQQNSVIYAFQPLRMR